MIIHALHKNGYVYSYDSSNAEDVKLWFEGRSIEDIKMAINYMGITDSPSDYPSVGMEVKLEYVDGVMDGSSEFLLRG